MSTDLPAIFSAPTLPALIKHEEGLLLRAGKLFKAGFPDHALLEVWNAAVHNLRRRIEAYGVELFQSAVKDEAGRKKYDKDGDSISDRWAGVDDLVLIEGAARLGVLHRKAGKALEMINWMRNHASPAHDNDAKVENEDVIALTLLLQKNLFEVDLPDPGHSPSGLFEPVKTKKLNSEGRNLLADQIRSFKSADVRVAFGFLLDMLCAGDSPSSENAQSLFPVVWEQGGDDLRKSAGARYHSFLVNPDADDSNDKGGKLRLLEMLTEVNGISFIPDAARATVYRRAAANLAKAKNKSYGFADEVIAAKTLSQFGTFVPAVAFEEVYQEILAVWCGNYWGRSQAYSYLEPFIDCLSTTKILEVCRMFEENQRVQDELSQTKPKARAVELVKRLKEKLALEAHIAEAQKTIEFIKRL